MIRGIQREPSPLLEEVQKERCIMTRFWKMIGWCALSGLVFGFLFGPIGAIFAGFITGVVYNHGHPSDPVEARVRELEKQQAEKDVEEKARKIWAERKGGVSES